MDCAEQLMVPGHVYIVSRDGFIYAWQPVSLPVEFDPTHELNHAWPTVRVTLSFEKNGCIGGTKCMTLICDAQRDYKRASDPKKRFK
jgi:hypothetical protein